MLGVWFNTVVLEPPSPALKARKYYTLADHVYNEVIGYNELSCLW